MDGDTLTSAESKVHMLTFKLDRVMEQSEGAIPIRGSHLIGQRPDWVNRGPVPRVYVIACNRQRDKMMGSLAILKSCRVY